MADKYVVLHSLIPGGFTRGAVVAAKDLGSDLGRCLDLGAVRKATRAEAGAESVTFAAMPEAHTLEGAIATKDEEIARLKERAAALETDLTAANSLLAEAESLPRGKAAEKAMAKLKQRAADLEGTLAARDELIGQLREEIAFLATAPTEQPREE